MLTADNQDKLYDASALIAHARLSMRGIAYKTANGGQFTELEVDGVEMILQKALDLIDSIDL